MSVPAPGQVRALYRATLKAARSYPSVKRQSIIEDIRAEFREKAGLTDPAAVRQAVAVGMRSLEQLESYVGWDSSGSDWAVSLKGSCD